MTGVPAFHPSEQLIGALIPPTLPRQRPPPLPQVELPPAVESATAEPVRLSMGRLDGSGRVRAATAVADLGWPPGTRLRADVRSRRIVLRPAPAGLAAVTPRAQIVLPIAARQQAGIGDSDPVLLAALPSRQVLFIHPAAEIARLLRRTHAQILGGSHGR